MRWRTSKKHVTKNGGKRPIDELMEINLEDKAIDDPTAIKLALALRRNGSVTSISLARGCVLGSPRSTSCLPKTEPFFGLVSQCVC